jgi:hypothetical protein
MKLHPIRGGAAAATLSLALCLSPAIAAIVTFESVALPPAGYQNGSEGVDHFTTITNLRTDLGLVSPFPIIPIPSPPVT